MRRAIAGAFVVDGVKDIRDKATAMDYCLAHNIEAERQCCEIRLRAERKGGSSTTRARRLRARGNSSNQHQREVRDENHSAPKNLAEHGVIPEEARRGKAQASLSDDEFEEALSRPGRLSNTRGIASPIGQTSLNGSAIWGNVGRDR